jgi:hypothetical protein
LYLCIAQRAGDVPLTLVNCKLLKQLFIANNCLDGLREMNIYFRDKFDRKLNVVL